LPRYQPARVRVSRSLGQTWIVLNFRLLSGLAHFRAPN
jgi:hypothetical protein